MKKLSRREFLKIAGLSMGALVAPVEFPRPQEERFELRNLGRVATNQISVHSMPRDDARIVKQLYHDELINIYYERTPETGPEWNPLWYRVWRGWVHSAHIQRVKIIHNDPAPSVRPEGNLGEITVPYAQAMRYSDFYGWEPRYRLYYETVHWIMEVVEGPDKGPWYKILDEAGDEVFYVPALHVRLIADEEIAPIAPDLPFTAKRVVVNIREQTLTAYQEEKVVLQTSVSTGIYTGQTSGIPTATPRGIFNIQSKYPSKNMTSNASAGSSAISTLIGVPWTAFFDERGYAIHGTFWHNNFGVQMSRGCVNMRNEEAKWLFRWLLPTHENTDVDTRGYGTRLEVV